MLNVFTYCRRGVSITEDMNMGRFLIWRLNPKTAFCWKPSLMLRIYWFWSVMNRTSLRPLKLASSMSFTTGCGRHEEEFRLNCFIQFCIFIQQRKGEFAEAFVSEVWCNVQITKSQAECHHETQTHTYTQVENSLYWFDEINCNWLGTAVSQGLLSGGGGVSELIPWQ